MSLSIYSITHPLVLNWASSIFSSNISNHNKMGFLYKIGLVLIYEATRKSLNTINLSIRKIDQFKEVNILPHQSSYFVISDIYLSQLLSKDIYSLLPNATIYPICHTKYSSDKLNIKKDQLFSKALQNSKATKIIILTESLNTNYINNIVKLIQDRDYSLNQLQICCIKCTTQNIQLIKSQFYDISIYTPKITD